MRDTIPILSKPVTFDPTTYNEFKNDRFFDYYYTKIEEPSFFQSLLEKIFSWLSRNINPNITQKQVDIGFWIVLGIIFLFIVWLVFHYRPSFFYINRKRKIDFGVEDEDIHDVDFDDLIKKASESGNYPEAIRWNYLQVLQRLHEKELISWDANKTVNEYVYELKRQDFKPEFKSLSRQFVYYRYGNGVASDEDFKQFAALSNQITRHIR